MSKCSYIHSFAYIETFATSFKMSWIFHEFSWNINCVFHNIDVSQFQSRETIGRMKEKMEKTNDWVRATWKRKWLRRAADRTRVRRVGSRITTAMTTTNKLMFQYHRQGPRGIHRWLRKLREGRNSTPVSRTLTLTGWVRYFSFPVNINNIIHVLCTPCNSFRLCHPPSSEGKR